MLVLSRLTGAARGAVHKLTRIAAADGCCNAACAFGEHVGGDNAACDIGLDGEPRESAETLSKICC